MMLGIFDTLDSDPPDAVASFVQPFFGQPRLELQVLWRVRKYRSRDIVRVVEIDADAWRSGAGAAAGAAVGGVLTGGLGLVAGAAFGGRRRQRLTFAADFADGAWVVAQTGDANAIAFLRREIARTAGRALREK